MSVSGTARVGRQATAWLGDCSDATVAWARTWSPSSLSVGVCRHSQQTNRAWMLTYIVAFCQWIEGLT